MSPRVRKFALTAHVTSSVGWLGAVVAYLPLAFAGLTSRNAETVRAAYLSMDMIGWFVIVPCSLAALLTGLVQSLGTEWGLVRYYWVLVKFLLTIGATTILLLHMPAVGRMSDLIAEPTFFADGFGAMQQATFAVHAGGGVLVLLTATALSIYKPWGATGYGRRISTERLPTANWMSQLRGTFGRRDDVSDPRSGPGVESMLPLPDSVSPIKRRRKLLILLGVAGLILLLAVLHLFGGRH